MKRCLGMVLTTSLSYLIGLRFRRFHRGRFLGLYLDPSLIPHFPKLKDFIPEWLAELILQIIVAPTDEWMEAMPTATVADLVHKLLCGLFDLGICICAVYNAVHFYLDLCERKLLRFLILCWVLLPNLFWKGDRVLRLWLPLLRILLDFESLFRNHSRLICSSLLLVKESCYYLVSSGASE